MKATVVVAGGVAAGVLQAGPHAGATVPAPDHAVVAARETDTATVRLHISGMTCGSCPTTARLALQRLSGVYRATVTLSDSLGVVRYDPRRVSPEEIATHLLRFTGFKATVLPDSAPPRGRPGG